MNKMLLLAVCAALSFVGQAAAAPWKIDGAHSQVQFKVRHLGISTVTGRFDTVEGTLEYDPVAVTAAKVVATVDVGSISTSQAKRDSHLKSCDFFCVESFPKITFTSKKVTPVDATHFKVTGDLSLHGITKEVTLDAEFLGAAKGPDGKERAGFAASTTVNRKDFGLSWDKITETGGIVVGAEVKVELEIQAVKS